MSTQLIIFPQSYNGQYNIMSSGINEYAVNGVNFIGLDSSSSFDSASASPVLNTLVMLPPSIINTWYRFRSTLTGTPALPIVTANDAVLSSTTTQTRSGIYQRLSNLVVGQQYTFRINLGTTGAGSVVLAVYSGAAFNSNLWTLATTTTTINHYFTATSTTDTIMIYYDNTTADTISIQNVSVFETGTTPPGYILDNGQVICDLYEDEDIPLTLSVDDFKNVAEAVQSYSKAFNLPATKRNNQIFDNVFEITRSAQGNLQFNPYAKTQCTLKQDGLVLFEGYLRLIDIQDNEGEISYDVNLYSEVVALMDVLGDKTFSELDFSELDHPYTYTEIRNSWQGNLTVAALPIDSFANNTGVAGATTTNVLAYPFIDWEHSYTVNSSSGFPVLPNLESAFRPFIKIRYLIEMIFNQADFPFTYTSDFISGDVHFQKLFMDFNWGDAQLPVIFSNTGGLTNTSDYQITASYATVDWEELDAISLPYNTGAPLPSIMGYSSGVFTATYDNQSYIIDCLNIKFENSTGADPSILNCEWVHTDAAGVEHLFGIDNGQVIGGSQNYLYNASFTAILQAGETLKFRAKNTGGGTSDLEIDTSQDSTSGSILFNTLININSER